MPDKSLMQDLAISVGQHLGASKAFKNTFPGTSCNNKFPEGGKLLGDDGFFWGGNCPKKEQFVLCLPLVGHLGNLVVHLGNLVTILGF